MLRRFEQFCTSAFSIYRSILKIERVEMENADVQNCSKRRSIYVTSFLIVDLSTG